MNLTVGKIEDMLRNYPKGTSVHLNCGCCHHGVSGDERILQLHNKTNQTFGYIELELNASSEGNVNLNEDKEEWYKGEIDKLKRELKKKDEIINVYEDFSKSIETSIKAKESHLKYVYSREI